MMNHLNLNTINLNNMNMNTMNMNTININNTIYVYIMTGTNTSNHAISDRLALQNICKIHVKIIHIIN